MFIAALACFLVGLLFMGLLIWGDGDESITAFLFVGVFGFIATALVLVIIGVIQLILDTLVIIAN